MDSSVKKNEHFINYVGCLPNQCYNYFNKRYKEYSDENKETKKININKVVQASVDDLQWIKAKPKFINKIKKLSVKWFSVFDQTLCVCAFINYIVFMRTQCANLL